MRAMIAGLVLAAALAGCNAVDTMADGFQHAQEVASDLGRSTGTRPQVGFRWANGSLASITLHYDGVPRDASIQEIARLGRQSVAKHFQQSPDTLVVSFAVAAEQP